jgi:PAS domain S-box-containing protein
MLTRRRDGTGPVAGDTAGAPPPGTPERPAAIPSHRARAVDVIVVLGGLLSAAIGLTVLVSWPARASAVLQLGSQHPMAFNTALAVTVTGAALAWFTPTRHWPVLVAGLFDAALGIVVLTEYTLGRSLGIDQLVVRAYLNTRPDIPGRPPVITAVCLALIGAALLVWGPWRARPLPAALAVAGSFLAGIAVTSLVGYAFGAPLGYVWLHGTTMAFLTAVTMLSLGLTLLGVAWRAAPAGQEGWPRWLPGPAGVLAFGLADIIWLAIVAGRAGVRDPNASTDTRGALVLGLLGAGLVALAVGLAQTADRRRRLAQAAAVRWEAAEATARASQARLFQFLDAMPIGVFITDTGNRPYYANQEAEGTLGRGVVPDIGAAELAETYSAFLAGTDQLYPADRLPIVRALRGESLHVSDLEIHHPDGQVIPLEVWGRPVTGAGGDIEYGLAVFADISERRTSEKTLADQAALLDLAHDAIFVQDAGGRITFWNAGAEHMYGFTRSEAVGRISHEILDTTFPEPLDGIEATLARDGRWEGELRHRCADGRWIVVESRWVAQSGPSGAILKVMEVNRDVTARKAAERAARRGADEIRELNANLERQVRQRTVHLQRANQNLATFSYSIAHDLRTPLRAMSGYAEALAEEYGGLLGDTGGGYARRIQAASEHMATLIDNLLHLSRVSQAEMNPQHVDLSAEATAICGQLRAGEPGREVQVTVEEGVWATADRNLMGIVLENLLQNAWKFTARRDGASIQFGTATVDGGRCCYVRDNGVGFDFAYADKLFQPFQRLHAAGEFAGTGVGLATVQRIIERHGGRAWAEGFVGRGATFYFTLDGPPAAAGELAPATG